MLGEWLIGAACIMLVYLVVVNWRIEAREKKKAVQGTAGLDQEKHGAEVAPSLWGIIYMTDSEQPK